MDRNKVSAVLANQDAVIQCLGVSGKSTQPTTFMSDVTKLLIEEMERSGVKRLIAMSNIGTGTVSATTPVFYKNHSPLFYEMVKSGD